MNRLFLCALLAFQVLSAQNTGTIRGSVSLERDGSALHGATVSVVQLRRSVQTDQDGTYRFENLPAGHYDIVAHLHALTDARQEIDLTPGAQAEVSFRLKLAPVRQEVTVTAAGHEETTLESFQTVTSLNGYQLTTRGAAPSLGEMLDHETGIAKRSFGPGSARPVVRGFDGDRVLVLQDGARTGTLSSQSGDHGEPVDPSSLERIEVVRGPATLLYGSNAIGGVVNIITRHHEMDQHPHSGVTGSLTGTAGSANGLGGGSGSVEFGIGNYLIWAMGSGQRTGDYKTPIGTIENSATNFKQTTAGVGKYGERTFFTFGYGLQDGIYGVPSLEHEGEDEEEHAHHNVQLDWRRHNARFHGGWRNLPGFFEGARFTANFSDWRHNELEGSEIGTRFSNKQFTYQGLFSQNRRGGLSGTLGFWGLRRNFKATGEEALAPPVDQNAFAVFALEEFQTERVRVQAGVRLEHNGYSPVGATKRSFTGVSGSAGIFVPLWTGAAIVTNYTSSYRAPALEELYNNGPHLGNLVYEIGNSALQRERGQGLEVALRQSSGRVRAELIGFWNRMSDFIYLAPTGDFEEELIVANYAQAPARYLGAEGRLDIRLHSTTELLLGFDAVDAQLRESRTPLPRIPPVRGRVGFEFRRAGFTVRPELILSNRQHQIFPTETETAGYAVTNLQASYLLARQHVSHLWSANVFNANDRLYRNHLSFIKEFAPEIGRGIRFSYTVNFY